MKISDNIFFGSITEQGFGELIEKEYAKSNKVIIVDENTHDNCLEYLLTTFPSLSEAEVMLLPAGEENKVMEVCFQVWNALSEYHIGRRDLIINLGGGVVTDMGGFIAAVFKRGVDFINIPTSLLGMVDASIGGKTGIDLGPFKNQLGVFANPKATYIDPIFLGTLPEAELWNGYAEMIKHALITSKELWNELKSIEDVDQLKELSLIQRSAQIKINIVEKDPMEKNDRKLLNFGHTVGHAVEGFLLDKGNPIAHGHAVAIGMHIEAMIALEENKLSSEEFKEISSFIHQKFPFVGVESEEEITSIIELMLNDKKNSDNKIKGILIEGIGKCTIDHEYDEKLIKKAMMTLLS